LAHEELLTFSCIMCNAVWGNIVNLYNNSMSWAVVMLSKLSFLNFDFIKKDARVCVGTKK